MPNFLAELFSQLKGIWSRLDAGQRAILGAVLFAALAGLGAIVWYAGRPDYQPVLAAGDPAQLQAATRALDSAGILYRQEGGALLVEARDLGRAKSELFGAGITASAVPDLGSALEDLVKDKSSREFKLAFTRDRHAEAQIKTISGVLAVSVMAHRPQRSSFAALDKAERAIANVVVKVRRDESFERIARACVDAVAAATGVPQENVTVTDAETKRSFSTSRDSGGGMDTLEFRRMQELEAAARQMRAQAWLERFFPHQAQVVVHVELDPQYRWTQRELLSDAPMLKSDSLRKGDVRNNAGGSAGGDPSATAAVVGTQGGTAVNGSSDKNELRERTYYDPRIGKETLGMLAPDVRQISIALAIDEAQAAKRKEIEDGVKAAVGWMAERERADGTKAPDVFSTIVTKIPQVADEPAVGTGPGALDLVERFAPVAGQALAVVLVLLFLRSLLRRGMGVRRAGGGPAAAVQEIKAENLAPEEQARRMRREIEKAIGDDPQAIARMVESWLAETKA